MTSVDAVDADGNCIDDVTEEELRREPDKFDDICNPDEEDLSPVQRRIVAAKMMHPDFSAQEIADFLDDGDYSPSKGHTGQTIREYFGTTKAARGSRPFEDFNERQQKAIDAAARYELGEFGSYTEAGEAIDDKGGYVNTCRYQYEEAVERRMEALKDEIEEEDGESNDTVRRENSTGTYAGPEKGIDATMQHISERPTRVDTGQKSSGDNSEIEQSEPTKERVETIQEKIDLLRRLVVEGALDAEVAFDEVERMVAEVSPDDGDSGGKVSP
ncbi:hypothetical protein [Natrinema salaciae]|uniref:Uncharacterized protein n=1 Tax=Natrinema salaciae TaxID=1186196 RepID=A0A1H9PVC3_9EURY|nr:hypothetical protein [Natrinema salaciae]SER51719.1 hypothetical protein SAMN04489841_3978 [Natrinema salaciae]